MRQHKMEPSILLQQNSLIDIRRGEPLHLKQVFSESLAEDRSFFGVFVAHGAAQHAANFACKFVRQFLLHNLPKIERSEKVKKLLNHAFEHCQLHMILHPESHLFHDCGSSACIGVCWSGAIWLAHIGEMHVCASQHEMPLFLDHKLSSVHEKERVLNGFGWYDVETMTVWGKSRLTRSLGDLWQLDHLKTLRFSGILKNLDHIRSNGGIKTLGALLQQHRVQFVIDFQPHIISVDTQQYLLLMSAPLYRQAPRWLVEQLINTTPLSQKIIALRTWCADNVVPGVLILLSSRSGNQKQNSYT